MPSRAVVMVTRERRVEIKFDYDNINKDVAGRKEFDTKLELAEALSALSTGNAS